MAADPPTQLIEQGELRVLVAATRDNSELAHIIRRPRATIAPRVAAQPSALRGIWWVVVFAWLARELVHFFQ
jgi:hypothetical protein